VCVCVGVCVCVCVWVCVCVCVDVCVWMWTTDCVLHFQKRISRMTRENTRRQPYWLNSVWVFFLASWSHVQLLSPFLTPISYWRVKTEFHLTYWCCVVQCLYIFWKLKWTANTNWRKGTFHECVMKYSIFIYAFFRQNVPSTLYVNRHTLKFPGVFWLWLK